MTVYRSRSMLWGARRATVLLDGEPVGTVRGKQRVSVQVADGQHQVAARIGRAASRPLTVVTGEADLIAAIRIVLPADRRRSHPPEDYLKVVPVTDFHDRSSVTVREVLRDRPPVGYRRLHGWERGLFAIALVVALVAQLLRHTLGRGVSLAIAGPAEIVLLVLIVRLFLYRPDK